MCSHSFQGAKQADGRMGERELLSLELPGLLGRLREERAPAPALALALHSGKGGLAKGGFAGGGGEGGGRGRRGERGGGEESCRPLIYKPSPVIGNSVLLAKCPA